MSANRNTFLKKGNTFIGDILDSPKLNPFKPTIKAWKNFQTTSDGKKKTKRKLKKIIKKKTKRKKKRIKKKTKIKKKKRKKKTKNAYEHGFV